MDHALKVKRIAAQLEHRKPGGLLAIRKRAVSHLVPKRSRPEDETIDTSDLDRILAIDPDRRICTAEPGVTFSDLVRATMEYGLVPKIVPELRTITIGGAVCGGSIESASFRFGGFHDTCLEYEVITSEGNVMRCSPALNPLVFQMLHGSFGTLGILSKLTFELMPAQPFVRVEHEKYASLSSYEAGIERHAAEQDCDFMDGFVHGPKEYVLCVGRFSKAAPYLHRYDWTKIYWQSTRERREDFLKTEHYFFRYDNGVTNVHPKSKIGRLLFGKFVHSNEILKLARLLRHWLPDERPDVTLDMFLPMSRVETFMKWHARTFDFYPLWVVPYRRVHDYEWIANDFYRGLDDDLFLDIAIYGMKQKGARDAYEAIEDELERIGGIKTLISHNHYDEEVFWRIFNRENHFRVKAITDPKNVFRDLWAKTRDTSRPIEARTFARA
jgi:FAD/FMN-containing dehydrogenase